MRLNELVIMTSPGQKAPRPGMKKVGGAGQSIGLAALAFLRGSSKELWVDPASTVTFERIFEIPDAFLSRKRKIVVEATLGAPVDAAVGSKFIEKSLEAVGIEELVSNELESALMAHFRQLQVLDRSQDPLFPARERCQDSCTAALQSLGLRIESACQVSVTPYIPHKREVINLDSIEVLPIGGLDRLKIDVAVTIEAPPTSPPSRQLLTWVLNQVPVSSGSSTVRGAIESEFRAFVDNRYRTQEFRRETQRIAQEAQSRLQSSISETYGFNVHVSIFEKVGGSDPLNYTGVQYITAPLLGTGRVAQFDVEYGLNVTAEERFKSAFQEDMNSAVRKKSANEIMSPQENAAQSGNIQTWANELIGVIVQGELQRALSEIDIDHLPGYGMLPEDTTLNLDDKINNLIAPICKALGFSAKVRTSPMVDQMLHQLTTGLAIDTPETEYDLAQTSIRPQLRFKYDVVLPHGAPTKLLIPYIQASNDQEGGNGFDLLRKTIEVRTQSVAALALGQLSPDDYLNKTGDAAAIRSEVEEPLRETLLHEFGLKLRDPLVVNAKPDDVQRRYIEMRSELREVKIPLKTQSIYTHEQADLVMSLRYQVDRLANPNVGEPGQHEGAIEAWERFRTMAMKYTSLDAHLKAFEEVVIDTLRSALETFTAEAFDKANSVHLRSNVTKAFSVAGGYFGLNVSVFEGTINVKFEGNAPSMGNPRLESARKRVMRLTKALDEKEEELDALKYGENDVSSDDPFSDASSNDPAAKRAELEQKIEDLIIDLETAQQRFAQLKLSTPTAIVHQIDDDDDDDEA